MENPQNLREKICAERTKLLSKFQQMAAEKVADHIVETKLFKHSQSIAAYMAMRGEINPLPLMRMAWQLDKICYLPILNHDKTLTFVKYAEGDPLFYNKYNVPEPYLDKSIIIEPKDLDLVIMPLVGFDVEGNRLGTGGGYYDRTFSFMNTLPPKSHNYPCLLGLAYEFQNISFFDKESWDVPLGMVATEIQLRDFKGRNKKD